MLSLAPVVLCSALIECTNSADLQTAKTLMVAIKADSQTLGIHLHIKCRTTTLHPPHTTHKDDSTVVFHEVNDARVGCHKKRQKSTA